MSSDQNNTSAEIPGNRMRLSEKFKKLKNGINLRTYTEHTEDKGSDTEVVEAEQGGQVISRFVKKDGKTLESQGSDDAQQSGEFDKIAKKVGAQDSIIHTKVEQVSEVAHDNQPSDVRKDNAKPDKVTNKPDGDHPLDNNQESSKEKFINNKAPKAAEKVEKSGIHYGAGQQTESYDRGGVPKVPKMAKDDGVKESPKPKLAVPNSIDYSALKPTMAEKRAAPISAKLDETRRQRGAVKNVRGEWIVPAGKGPNISKSGEQPLKKKWQVFMDSMKGFKDPLKKDPLDKGDVTDIKGKNKPDAVQTPAEKPTSTLSEHAQGFWDVLGRKKKPATGGSTESKIRAALDSQKDTNPYATDRGDFVSVKQTPVNPKYDAALNAKQTGKPAPVKGQAQNSTGTTNIKLAAVTENPKKRPGRKKTSHIKVIKSLQMMVERLRKGDVINFPPQGKPTEDTDFAPVKESTADKMKRISSVAKKFNDQYTAMGGRKGQLNPAVDEEGVPHKFWGAFRKQQQKKARQEQGKKIPVPDHQTKVEIQEHPPEVIDVEPEIIDNMNARLKDDTKKSSVTQNAQAPTQNASKTPTIENTAETTIGKKPLSRDAGLAKDDGTKIDKKITPQHLPSAENGLEEHLTNLTSALQQNEQQLMSAQKKESYGSDMSKVDRDKNIKMAERTHKYLTQGIELTRHAIEARDSENPNWSSLLGVGNPKVNQMGIITLGNTLPGHNCPARGGCGDGSCYGMNGQQAMGNALMLRARNAGLIHRPDFVQGAIQAIQNAPKHMVVTTGADMFEAIKDHPRFKSILMNQPTETKDGMIRFKVKAGDVYRWHDTGDILNEKHLDDMVSIARAFPEKKFYAYTKSMHLPLDKLRALPNFNVVQSLGGEHNDKIDTSKPHAKFFESLDHAEASGYTPVWFHDWPAASGVTNIALVPHGSRQKEVDVSGFNEGVNPEPQDPTTIKKSSVVGEQEPAWMQFDQPDSVAQSAAMGKAGKMRAMMMVNHNHKNDHFSKSAEGNHPESFMSSSLSKGSVTNIFKNKLKPNLDSNRAKVQEVRQNTPAQEPLKDEFESNKAGIKIVRKPK